MDRSKNSNRKGQALFLSLLLIFMLAILTGGLAAMWQSEVQIRGLEKNNMIALYMAQAGLERAKIVAKYGLPRSASPTLLGGGRYTYTITDNYLGDANRKSLTGTGQVLDSAGNIIAERTISVVVHGFSTPPLSQDAFSWWDH
jgi:hypothetical protein